MSQHIKTKTPFGMAKMLWSMALVAAGTYGVPETVIAAEQFSNGGIRFEVDTVVEFEFVESNGAYQSTFGIINLETGARFPLYTEVKPSDIPQSVIAPSDYLNDAGVENQDDFQGTPGNTVPVYLGEFTFVSDTDYTFYLESYFDGQPAGVLYSTNTQNMDSRQFAQFDTAIDGLMEGGIVLRWDDSGTLLVDPAETDYDYDDFIIRMGGHLVWDRPGEGCYPPAGDRLGDICFSNSTN